MKLLTARVDRIMEPAASTSQSDLTKDRSLRNGRSAQGLRDVVSRAVVDHAIMAEAPMRQVALSFRGIPTNALSSNDGVEAGGVGGME